jgi:hypothetical protein
VDVLGQFCESMVGMMATATTHGLITVGVCVPTARPAATTNALIKSTVHSPARRLCHPKYAPSQTPKRTATTATAVLIPDTAAEMA